MATSPRFVHLARTFAAAFDAAREHAKTHPHEADQLFATVASHVRNAAPMVLLGIADVVEPANAVTVAAIDGRVEVSISGECVCLYAFDSSGHDAAPLLTRAQAEELRIAIARVMAAGKEAA